MYWDVSHEDTAEDSMPQETGTADEAMGSKQSGLESPAFEQCSTLQSVQAAYSAGEVEQAQHLARLLCEEAGSSEEKSQLLTFAASHGDAETVRFLVQDVQVGLSKEPSHENPIIIATHQGHEEVVKVFLDSMPGACMDLLSCMLAAACRQGHMSLVQLLVVKYKVEVDSCGMRTQNHPVIMGQPLYAAMQAGNEEIAAFLLENGAHFTSYVLMDHPQLSKQLLRTRFTEPSPCEETYTHTVAQPLTMGQSLKWSRLELPWLDLDWFIDVSIQVTELDLARNNLTLLPSIIPWGLVHLRKLNVSANQLKELPNTISSEEILCTGILEMDVSRNQLTSLPTGILHLPKLQKLKASNNLLDRLFDEEKATNWIGLRKLSEIDVSDNRLEILPTSLLHCFKSLSCLIAAGNVLRCFPEPWACGLKFCNVSRNSLESLPNSLCDFWKNYLKEADFSNNLLKELPSNFFELQALNSLKLSGNQLQSLPSVDSWQCPSLRSLDLSRNHFGKGEEPAKTRRVTFFTPRLKRGLDTISVIEFPHILGECLEILHLDGNFLDSVPPSVCSLRTLSELYLSNNPGIRELPAELGQLSNLWQLDIDQLNISNVPIEIRNQGPTAVLAFLRAHLRKAEPCRLLKMIVVGPPRQGKTTLLETLQTGKPPQPMYKESSIHTTIWELQRPAAVKTKVDSVVFNVWDIGGAAKMATVNQCFFTEKALYVVVWNLALGEEAVANLQSWLLNIEAKAPNATVIVVGTHLDLIDTKFRTERLATLRAYILALCRSPSGPRASGYPDISCRNLHELSCRTLDGLDGLRKLIFQVACGMRDAGSVTTSQKLVGRLIPRSYLKLRTAVVEEQQRRSDHDEVQYITDQQLQEMVPHTPGNDINDFEDLQAALAFLIETGAVLHFPDTSHGLRNLYFLHPVWLSECLEKIINIKASRSLAMNGVIRLTELRKLLLGTGFTQQTEEQYLQFLAKFEIALPIANDSYLLPHLLPSKPGIDSSKLHQPGNCTIQRLFKMNFVPIGFWQRFIARILISLSDMDAQLVENEKNVKRYRGSLASVYSFTGTRRRNRCSTFRVKRNQTIYWQEGLQLTYMGGCLSVESSEMNWKRKKSAGIKIVCQSETRDFSAVAFITDHVNSLIDQWFPALTATESDGSPLVEQYVPCPHCSLPDTQRGQAHLQGQDPHYFSMEDCLLTAIEHTDISCPNHPATPVPLDELVPEIFMTDFPSRLFLDVNCLEQKETSDHILGQGGSGAIVYKAKYNKIPVAIKKFHFKNYQALSGNSRTDSMLRHLEALEVMRSFSEFRQESSILHTLQHPCIVSLVGLCIHPLCFALELAPLGSLNNVLKQHSKGTSFMPLGHMLTYRIAYQIALGLAYLHRKKIIFCDLKSDNVLVWSLDVSCPINVKLSDYGVSRQSFHEGALGIEGTPGYQAPEILPGIVYDEKVDLFSFGMVLYELLSGQRPILGHHQVQIVKKLSKGIRPLLGSLEEVQFHPMQSLMIECWDTKPEKRPAASCVVRLMRDPSFPVFMYTLQTGRQHLFCPSLDHERTVIFWNEEGSKRNYSVVNIDKGLIEVDHISCPGAGLSCQLKLHTALWTATKDQKIQVYSLKGMCPLKVPLRVLDVPAVVTCFLSVSRGNQKSPLMLAGMADGMVAVYSLASELPWDWSAYLCSRSANNLRFKIPDSDRRQNAYPVTDILAVNNESEVWYTNGPGILVIDTLTVEISRRLEPYQPPSQVISMVSNLGCDGEETVWCLDDKTSTLIMYRAYQVCAHYACNDCNPLRDMFPIQHPVGVMATLAIQDSSESHPTDTTFIVTDEVGTQILQHCDSVTDYCSISSCSSSANNTNIHFPSSPTSIPNSPDFEGPGTLNVLGGGSQDITPTAENRQQLRAVKVLAVRDTLWVPREGGDIVVIELQTQIGGESGRVVSVLRAGGMNEDSSLVEAALVAQDTVVCCLLDAAGEWRLCVWRGWGSQQFQLFYQSLEELGTMEVGMRRRR
ncbi:leucine-rich repeat serine/threonine-protein kinase 1 [Amblyraja radiata]|uniref:leucine-rich repeat serine/threonine-protein kinase 1 n=1 Tax=Amblyraja radiata TaxID=386614 RepID=UPI00140267C2|nr:leucine-rich repeat serine/threonine-protein kinase 1 [Amblyraja radiata]XP_032906425.1 leucine-rich repeat serine/threonine-protein kinase 1 [Amblyraja radiata]XP_032906426.1 leucine-rich repeat serine/threonine-protein kinase 1 [Amblyraja radiata]XP_032906427.1 leucine-rich repeat serine/threonine-protein kinase 1 [Amblyraja radiata]XP_032906428.1 leucine-rich repeat serine/threonine-protein kinase 1 [Amblyraja radiata]XP_032906430.1 leucine-rich repeat serine/threonine-protein kinase 1 [